MVVYGSNFKNKELPAGIDSDSIAKRLSNHFSEERIPSKAINTELKLGMSRESPFINHSHGRHFVHPATKVIFGDPEIKPRPYSSKVNSMIEKSRANYSPSNSSAISNYVK